MTLKDIIHNFQSELDEKAQIHEEIANSARKINFLSKYGIFAIHRGDLQEAKSKIIQMNQVKSHLDELLRLYHDLYTGSVRVAYQEYAEAHILLTLVETGVYPDPDKVNVAAISYILGLADSIGELRRRVLNCLLEKNYIEAERCLQLMEEIFGELIALDKAHILASELRRKCDVARRIVESTLGNIVMDARGRTLQNVMKRLEDRLQKLSETI